MGDLFWSCWPVSSYSPQILQCSIHTLVYPLDFGSVIKTHHNSVIEHGETELSLTWKLHPHWLAYAVLDGAMHARGGKSTPHSYPSVNPGSYNNDHPGKTSPLVQYWHECSWGS